MPSFEELRDKLTGQRDSAEEARRHLLLAREAVEQTRRNLAEFERTADPQDERQREELKNLKQQEQRARRRVDELSQSLKNQLANQAELWAGFESLTDPREMLRQWDDRFPILLFPVRIETRFKTGTEGRPQLWVRVYPDDCLLDTFEDSLTEKELENARIFWTLIWQAGGDEALERAAWRNLVASHGSGRAGWIVRQYAPLNPDAKPVSTSPSEILLVIVTADPLPSEAAIFWLEMWRAVDDEAAQTAAFEALKSDVGAERADQIINLRPVNFDTPPPKGATRRTASVKVAILELTAPGAKETRRSSWSSAPRVYLLPDRFVLLGYRGNLEEPEIEALGNPIQTPLVAGPDPNAPPDKQLKSVEGKLSVPDEIVWMFDFERALKVGMAFRIDLTVEQARQGFDRLVVLGVRLSDSPDAGSRRLETLIEHHLYSRKGLELIPQGAPTNNTEKGGSGFSVRDDSDASFDALFRQKPQYSIESDPLLRRDGQWFAEMLGIGHETAQRILNAGMTDQKEARAMNIALWPGTMGYMMRTMMSPVFPLRDIEATRAFFTRYVSGRGAIPALRIGRQPYGILPTAAFSKLKWFESSRFDFAFASLVNAGFPGRLYELLKSIDAEWAALMSLVSYIGKQGDPHQILLDVLGLHPSSVEYYPLQADSVTHKFHELLFISFPFAIQLASAVGIDDAMALLKRLGYQRADEPDVLKQIYHMRQTPLDGPVIDDRPLSEIEKIRAYASGKNYIAWLIETAQTGIDALRAERGFDEDKKPAALLYLLLRHALQVGFHETGVRQQIKAKVVAETPALFEEPSLIHVQVDKQMTESRYGLLYAEDPRITGRPGLRLGDFIAERIRTIDPEMREQIEALESLQDVPTARLERIFAEHLDCCSYRLDAWKSGLIRWQLEQMRQLNRNEEGRGVFLGAFGWLVDVAPENKKLSPVQLPAEIDELINKDEQIPLVRDETNAGLIHAPSLNHATTAAVLRNGYLSNDGRLAVNLSSRRVQRALGVLEGMRMGQSLGALLGYHFERFVHDGPVLQANATVFALRKAFPLVAEKIKKTQTDNTTSFETIAAMNVVDGLKLVEHVQRSNNRLYPFGLTTLPPIQNSTQAGVINKAVEYILDINDAVADLILAEGVHQAVLGNYDRSAGTLDAFSKGNYPPEPEVIRTPRSGVTLTHRVAIHLPVAPAANPLPAILMTAMAKAEPSLNAWLAGRLPDPSIVGAQVSFTDRVTGDEQTVFISQEDLGLQSIDLVYHLDTAADQTLQFLDDRILELIYSAHAPRLDLPITILYTKREVGQPMRISWFELQALIASLRALTVGSRPLQPADLARQNDADAEQQSTVTLDKARIENALNDLQAIALPDLTNPATAIDAHIDQFVAAVKPMAAYRLPQTGTGFTYEWRSRVFSSVAEKIGKRLGRWNQRLQDARELLDDYDALPLATPDPERIAKLQEIESMVGTSFISPQPTDPFVYRGAVGTKKTDFENKAAALRGVIDGHPATLQALIDGFENQLPITQFDLESLELEIDRDEIERFRLQLVDTLAGLKTERDKRIAQVQDLLVRHDAANPAKKIKLLQQAAGVIFGEDFKLIPQFGPEPATAIELDKAWQHSRSGELTRHLTDNLGTEYPVDDWLHGIARVRVKMWHCENALMLGEAFAVPEFDLTPLQLPFKATDSWLALEFPEEQPIIGDPLLYTGQFAEDFDKTQPVCGLLVDEWTEVIPGTEETTGITFHYDRPNSEPPQAWLLALPALMDGTWTWQELVDAVNQTLDAAKRRAIEPSHVDQTTYSRFLPATFSAYTFPEISISNNLLRNVGIYQMLQK